MAVSLPLAQGGLHQFPELSQALGRIVNGRQCARKFFAHLASDRADVARPARWLRRRDTEQDRPMRPHAPALAKWEAAGAVFIIVAGSALHFAFDLSGQWRPAALFAAVN